MIKKLKNKKEKNAHISNLTTHRSNGITLIALILTVIVLLILAGVVISQIQGDGILSHAKKASNQYNLESIIEEVQVHVITYKSIQSTNKNLTLKDYLIDKLTLDEETIIYYQYAKAMVFWYKDYLFVLDENEWKIVSVGGDEAYSNSEAVLYHDVLNEGKYVLYVRKNPRYGLDRFWNNNSEYRTNIKTAYMDNQVTSSDRAVFQNETALENVYLSENIPSTGVDAFWGCTSLKKIILPPALVTISLHGFTGCASLENINLPDSIETIGAGGFNGCQSLTRIELPKKLTSIANNHFQNCKSLEEIFIPSSVTSIGGVSFLGTNLKKIYYGGTQSEWNNITIDTYGNPSIVNSPSFSGKYWYSETKPIEEGNYWHYVGGKIVEW